MARRSLGERNWQPALVAFCSLVFLFLVLPIFIVIPLSFSSAPYLTFPPPGFSLRWYRSYLFREQWRDATVLSVQVALLTTVLATVLGTLAAFALARGRFPLKRLVSAFLISPMIVPVIIMAIAVYFLFARLQLIGTALGMVLAHTVLAMPFVIVTVSATLKGFDRTLEHAARTLGAGSLQTFFRVTLPIIQPGVISGALFAFITSFDEVVISIFISGTSAITLPKQMWDGIRTELDPTIAAVSALLITMSTCLLLALALLARRTARLRAGSVPGGSREP